MTTDHQKAISNSVVADWVFALLLTLGVFAGCRIVPTHRIAIAFLLVFVGHCAQLVRAAGRAQALQIYRATWFNTLTDRLVLDRCG